MEKTPAEVNNFWIDLLEFILRNLFGFITTLAGIAYQVYQMTGRGKRLTRSQCISSVLMWVLSSFAIILGLADANINKLFYGLACWLTPIIVKPVSDAVSVKAGPIAERMLDSIAKFFEAWIKSKKA